MLPQLVESGQFKREYRDHRLEWMLRSGGVDIVLEGMQQRQYPLLARAGVKGLASPKRLG